MSEIESTASSAHTAWRARFIVGFLMLAIAFLGMIFTNITSQGGWIYWRTMTPIYALLSIGLSLYLRKMKFSDTVTNVWHEIWHWFGLLLAVFLLSKLVDMGFINQLQAGIQVLLLLALATFLAGVYIESTFIVVGILLGLMIWMVGLLNLYLYAFALLGIIVFALVFYLISKFKKTDASQ